MSSSRSSLLDRLIASCFGLLLAALALFVAVRLIERIWLWLLLGAVLVGLVAVAVRWYRGSAGGGW